MGVLLTVVVVVVVVLFLDCEGESADDATEGSGVAAFAGLASGFDTFGSVRTARFADSAITWKGLLLIGIAREASCL
jgi:branched-subunit amino acid permease